MRRSLIVTVAATVTMVLLAMLVPMAVLVRSYALEDRLARAALEVQAIETVVSGQDVGAVNVYLERLNVEGDGIRYTVLYPDGLAVGPNPGEDARVEEARRSGRARVDDTGTGAQILVPVSLGGSSTLPSLTPVVRVDVRESATDPEVLRAWLVLALLGLVLLGVALLLADRLGRSLVRPLAALAAQAQRLGERREAHVAVEGPPEVRELGTALNRLVGRVETLLERERRSVADLSHRLRTPVTALRLRIEGLPSGTERDRLAGDLDELERMVDHVVREARRSEREGLVADADALEVLADRVRFWVPLVEDQGRPLELVRAPGSAPVRASREDLRALVDVLLDNALTHTPDGAAVRVEVAPLPGGGARLVVDDAGPGFPDAVDVAVRGASGAGSTGLGLSIVARTAAESGGGLELGRSPTGGARAAVTLGPPD